MERSDNSQKIAKLFRNTNLDSQLTEEKRVRKKHLTNILNYINFQDGTILINFKHPNYGNIISLQARPQPCLGDILECLWAEKTDIHQKLKSSEIRRGEYEFLNFMISDGQKLILVKPDIKEISERSISFILPETCNEVGFRKVKRHSCEDIQVQFIQNSAIFHGTLLDFNAISFRVEISAISPQTFQWINPASKVNIIFKDGQDILYSGECMIIRKGIGQKTRTFALEPLHNQIRQFKPKEFRSPRHKLLPSPNIIFRHPLTRKITNLNIEDLAGSGLSVEERYDNSVLLPGLIIPELEIEFTNDFRIKCKCQVVYRNVYRTEKDEVYARCGIAFLDMELKDQARLSGLLHQVTDEKSYACNKVNLDDLWKFFFETGFIYPTKYTTINANKEKFRKTYEKLYIYNPNIARHFIYQDKGIIQGHMSMVRFYENTWLFQHHVASRSGYGRAGFFVLNQIGRYVNDFYNLYSTHMNFVISYFRPENKFPNRVFGGFTRELKNPKGSSLDSFAYFHFPKDFEFLDLSDMVLTTKTQPEDLIELERFYEDKSGGLMLSAFDLKPDMIDNDTLSKEYQMLGFKRERHLFSLKKDDILKAVIMVNVSDIGLNLSNLTNCIHVFVLDSDNLSRKTLISSLSMLSKYYEQDKITVLIYPVSYAESQLISYDRVYNLWVISPQYTDHFLKYTENLFVHAKHA